jgi:flagellar basal body-associated protein FliL
MNNKMVMIVGVVLIVVSITLSAVSVIMVNKVLGQINNDESMSAAIEDERVMVPIAKQTVYEMADSIIAIFTNEVDGELKGTLNVSVKIGFGIYAEDDEEGVLAVATLIQEKEGYLRDRISKLLSAKTYEYMSQEGIEELLQEEILLMVSYELETEYILQVYFPDGLLTSYR